MIPNKQIVAFMYCTVHDCGVLCCNEPNYEYKCEHGSDNRCVLSHTGTISYNDMTLDVVNDMLLSYNERFNGGFEFHMFSSIALYGEKNITNAEILLNQWIRILRELPELPKYQIKSPVQFVVCYPPNSCDGLNTMT